MTDSLTLTAKDRSARWLLFRHDRRQKLSGLKIWEKPAIYFIDQWLKQAWLQSSPDQYVLTELQSKHLWQKIIREDVETPDLNLLHVQGAATQAFQAYQLIRQYRLPQEPSEFEYYTEETRAFYGWMKRYREQLQAWKALDPSELLDGVLQRMEQGHIPLPEEITLHGFDEFTTQQSNWINFLKSRKVPIHFTPFEPGPVSPEDLQALLTEKSATVQKYEDANEEVTQCARWIRSVYQEGQTIGVVIPELERYRAILERELKAELAPESVYPWVDKHIPFNISMGTPLSHEPMVHLALLLLAQSDKRIPLITFSTLITSPFIRNPSEERQYRRELEWNLRGGTTTHVFLPRALNPEDKKRCPVLDSMLEELMKWMDDKSLRLPSEWALEISEFLKNVAWPTDQETISSRQIQALNSWKECLDSLSSLDRILEKINHNEVVSHLTHIAGETRFQPKTAEESIQVVDFPESAGIQFDHLWIMGCHADALPPFPKPNPFIPFNTLQRQFDLPHTTAERELYSTEQTLFTRAHACDRLVFSYPAWQGETEMNASPLLHLRQSDKNTIHITESNKLHDHPKFSLKLETLEDFFPIPVTPDEKKWIKGGSSLLKNQAECPFRAFAIHRLASKQKEFAELDMDESFRGTVIHKILELFWNEVRTSEILHIMNETGKLFPQIQKNVQEGMQAFALGGSRQRRFYVLESERLVSLIREWMEKELERPSFEVLGTEELREVQFDGLNLKLKLDRVDKTPNGKFILIDYKTGQAAPPTKWFEDHIQEPQLPLYALQIPTDAVAFANVRRGEYKFKGVAAQDDIIPPLKSDYSKHNPDIQSWDRLKTFWKDNLTRTANEFLEGRLEVDPIDGEDICRYCDQITFCRKTELLNHISGNDE